MKKILLSLCLLVVSLFAKEGYVDVNVLLIKKDPSDASVKFGYYEKYEKITVVDMIDGIDNDDKWYLTNRGYVRAKYVILDEQLPKLLTPNEVDTTKNALQLAVYPKRAKNSLKDAIKKLMGEENVFVEETSKAKVLYLVNFPSYRAALNKLEEVPFKGFVTRMKLKSIEKVNTTAPVKKNKRMVEKKETVKQQAIKKVLADMEETTKHNVKPQKIVRKMVDNQVPQSVMMDDDAEIDAIMKQIDNESYNKKVAKKQIKEPSVEKVTPNVVKKGFTTPKKETFIALNKTKVQKRDDFNMDKELAKTLENALLALEKL
jgi:hypothetical protein